MTTDGAARTAPLVTRLGGGFRHARRLVDDELTLTDEALPQVLLRNSDLSTISIDSRFTRVRQETTDDD